MDVLQEQARVSDMVEHVCKDDEVETPTGADDAGNLARDDLALIADPAGCNIRRMRRIFGAGRRNTSNVISAPMHLVELLVTSFL